MKKVTALLMFLVICIGCATSPTVQSPQQARERATYYRTQAAAMRKQVRRQEYVIERLQEQIENARKSVPYFEKQVKATKERLAELRQKTPTTRAERKALESLIRDWRTQKEHMQINADEQETLISFLQEQLRMQRGYRDQLKRRRKGLLQKAHKMDKKAKRLERTQEAKKEKAGS